MLQSWDMGQIFYFPSGGRHVENFYVRKIQRLRLGLNPQTWVPEASMLTTRPPKPSTRYSKFELLIVHFMQLTKLNYYQKQLPSFVYKFHIGILLKDKVISDFRRGVSGIFSLLG